MGARRAGSADPVPAALCCLVTVSSPGRGWPAAWALTDEQDWACRPAERHQVPAEQRPGGAKVAGWGQVTAGTGGGGRGWPSEARPDGANLPSWEWGASVGLWAGLWAGSPAGAKDGRGERRDPQMTNILLPQEGAVGPQGQSGHALSLAAAKRGWGARWGSGSSGAPAPRLPPGGNAAGGAAMGTPTSSWRPHGRRWTEQRGPERRKHGRGGSTVPSRQTATPAWAEAPQIRAGDPRPRSPPPRGTQRSGAGASALSLPGRTAGSGRRATGSAGVGAGADSPQGAGGRPRDRRAAGGSKRNPGRDPESPRPGATGFLPPRRRLRTCRRQRSPEVSVTRAHESVRGQTAGSSSARERKDTRPRATGPG